MTEYREYVDDYCSGQHDVLTWLSVKPDPDDHPLVAIDERVQFRAAMISLAANIGQAAALCRAFYSGFSEGFSASGEGFNGEYAPRLTTDGFKAMAQSTDTSQYGPTWKPGCGKETP